MMKTTPKTIVKKIRRGEHKICVVGLGRIGLPTACLLAKARAYVVGVDKNLKNLKLISEGKPPFEEKGLQPLLRKVIESGRFTVSSNLKQETSKCDIIIILVSTLIDANKNPDYSQVEDVCRDIGLSLQEDSLIIMGSTVGPGFTENVAKKIIEKHSGFKAGEDFGLAYSPVRASSGRILHDLQSYPRIVAGVDRGSIVRACSVLSLMVKGGFVVMDSIKAAEAAKVFENVYRDVNIALANVLASFCEEAGLNYKKIAEAANTQPFCHLHRPGIVGGTCIPVTPYFLISEAESLGLDLDFVKMAREVNEGVASRISKNILKALEKEGIKAKKAKILILGFSYKANSKGEYLTPCMVLTEILRRKGVDVSVWDPLYTKEEIRELGFTPADFEETVRNVDCLIVGVGHSVFKRLKKKILENLNMKSKKTLVFDVSGYNIFTPDDSTSKVKCMSIGFIRHEKRE